MTTKRSEAMTDDELDVLERDARPWSSKILVLVAEVRRLRALHTETCMRAETAERERDQALRDVRIALGQRNELAAAIDTAERERDEARAWFTAGPDNPTSIEAVVERLLLCGTGPTPEGYHASACVVVRHDLREVVRALRTAHGERDEAQAQLTKMQRERDEARTECDAARADLDEVAALLTGSPNGVTWDAVLNAAQNVVSALTTAECERDAVKEYLVGEDEDYGDGPTTLLDVVKRIRLKRDEARERVAKIKAERGAYVAPSLTRMPDVIKYACELCGSPRVWPVRCESCARRDS